MRLTLVNCQPLQFANMHLAKSQQGQQKKEHADSVENAVTTIAAYQILITHNLREIERFFLPSEPDISVVNMILNASHYRIITFQRIEYTLLISE